MVNVAAEMIDRRRLRRRLSFWRIAAIAIAVVALIAAPFLLGYPQAIGGRLSDQIARVSIEGMILDVRATPLHLFAHQHGKQTIGLAGGLHGYFQEGSAVRIHGGVP